MTTVTIATPPSSSIDEDDDSQQSPSRAASSSRLNFRQAIALARRMRSDLRPQTKDRKWKLRTYSDCFKASHALSWALEHISTDESVAVERLNQLVDYGLLTHVVDPAKKFRVGDTRTLYFRVLDDAILDRMMSQEADSRQCPGRGAPLMAGNFTSSINSAGGDLIAMQQRLQNVEHVLQETVKELNDARGKLEMTHHEVLGLISQQVTTFVMIFFMYIIFMVTVTPLGGMSWVGAAGLTASMIMSVQYGWRCISLWSDVDSRTIPMEAIITEEENSLAEGSIVRQVKSFDRKPTTSSIASVITKSFRSSVMGKSSRSVSIAKERSVVFMREAYSLPDVGTWKHRPLLICANTPVCPELVPAFGVGPVPLGKPFKFSSDLFEGTCLIRLKGTDSDDREGDEEYFSGRKRIFQSVVQGKFKEAVPVSDVLTGHEFTRPLKNLPHPFILKTATSFIGKVSPGANICVHTDQPFVEVPLGSSSQIIRGDEPGNEPSITCRTIQEDCSVFGGAFAKGNVAASRRKRLFANPAKCKEYSFDTETVYTFEFYQNLFDAQTYSLDLGFAKIGCSKVLNGQPIQWLGKMKDGRYLWSFQIWHEKLLSSDACK